MNSEGDNWLKISNSFACSEPKVTKVEDGYLGH